MTELSIFFVCAAVVFTGACVCEAAKDMFMRWTRSKNIAAHGWPPKHLDADGDPVTWYPDDEPEPTTAEAR